MLVLSRRLNEKILFPGTNTIVRVLAVKPGRVRLGIEAPPGVAVVRPELHQRGVGRKKLRHGDTETLGRGDRPSRQSPRPRVPPSPCPIRSGLKAASVGLGLARLQLSAGQTEDAQATLEQLHTEMQRLRRRLEAVPEKAVSGSSAVPAQPPTVDSLAKYELVAGGLR